MIAPFREGYKHQVSGLSGGLSSAGYDVHMANTLVGLPTFKQQPRQYDDAQWILPPRTGCLAVTLELFRLPDDVAMHYYNKSTLARKFLSACATLGEPGWTGHLTLELYNQTDENFILHAGQPIGQVVFITLDQATEKSYAGKYQNQGSQPEKAR